jgi:hypothetical protein
MFNYSRPATFADLRIAVLLIRGKTVVATFVHHGVGPSVFRGSSCAGARSRPKLTISAPKKGLQMADDFGDHFFELVHFMDRCMKFKREMEAVMAPYKEVYKDMRKQTKHPKITSSTVFSYAIHSISFDYPDNLQPGTPTSSQ